MRSQGEATGARVRRRVGLGLAAAIFVTGMLGGTLPIPLYQLWAPRLDFGPFTTTLIFSTYAAGVVLSLVLLGSLSDRMGRKPVLAAALVVNVLSTLLFLGADSVTVLLVARATSGLAAGLLTAAASAAISDLSTTNRRASVVATAANLGGLGLGPIAAGLVVRATPDAVQLVFAGDLALLTAGLLALIGVPETVPDRRRPQLRLRRPALPAQPAERRVFLGAGLVAAAALGVNGFFSSLAPAFLHDRLHVTSSAVVGSEVGLLFVVALCAQLLSPASWLVSAVPGVVVLTVGVLILEGALVTGSSMLFLVGTVVSGAGVGLTFRRGLGIADRLAAPGRTADLTATYFLSAYLGLILPTLVLGLLADPLGQAAAAAVLIGIVLATAAAGVVLTRGAGRSTATHEGNVHS